MMKTTIIQGDSEALATGVGLDELDCHSKKLDKEGEIKCNRERNEN